MTRSGNALTGVLAHHVPVKNSRSGNSVIEDCSRLRVSQSASSLLLLHEFSLDAFVDHYKDERHFWLVSSESLLDLFYLVLLNGGNLLVADTVPEDDHSLREAASLGFEGKKRFTNDLLELSDSSIFS